MRDPKQTKHRLIEVTSKLMADLGAAGLRVDQVAALAKVNKRMIYHYFGDKEGLTVKVLAQQVLVLTPVLSGREVSTLAHLLDYLPVSANDAGLRAEQPSTRAQRQAAVILMRALLDRWQLLSESTDRPIQSLLGRLSALALGLEPQPRHSAEPAAPSLQQPRKERISLRPTVNLIHSRA